MKPKIVCFRELSIGVEIIIGVATFLVVQIYFIPVRIAVNRKHPNTMPIVVLTIAGGWTGLLWIGALVWSLYKPEKELA
jgi:hypothetical protein